MIEKRLGDCRKASSTMTLAIALPVAVTMGVGGVLATTYTERGKIQDLADEAALAAARELVLSSTAPARVKAVAEAVVAEGLKSRGFSDRRHTVNASVLSETSGVTVEISLATAPMMASLMPDSVAVSSTARLNGATKLCIVALDARQPASLAMTDRAHLLAPTCAIYSNSTDAVGLAVRSGSAMVSEFACSGGGFDSAGTYLPTPVTDCPRTPDPLASRRPPQVGACTRTGTSITAGTVTLSPGVYCGGLKISGTAEVRLQAGVYVMKDGPLEVSERSRLSGRYVGFYMTGDTATFSMRDDASIDIGAPKDGPMAGLLFHEDRTGSPGKTYQIGSSNADRLLGTFYLPRGKLVVDATGGKVAEKSEYTAIVARLIDMRGSTMVINADYGRTDVPVPTGLGETSLSSKIYLSE